MTWSGSRVARQRQAAGPIVLLVLILVGVTGFVSPFRVEAAVARTCETPLIPMSDGVRLFSEAALLDPAKPHVTSVELSAYPNTSCPTKATNFSPELSDMMNIVVVSLRGTGSSEGLFDWYGSRTQKDINQAIDWIAKQPWSNGKIVLTGFSGTAIAEGFAYGNPHVVAAVTGSSCTDWYDQCVRQGGTLQYQGQLNLAGTDRGYAEGFPIRMQMGLATNPPPPEQIAAFPQMHAAEATNDLRDAWWQERSALPLLSKTKTPVFYLTDNFDIVNAANYASFIRNAPAGHSYITMGFGHTSSSHFSLPNFQDLIYKPIDDFVRHYAFGEPTDVSNHVTVQTTVGGFSSFAPRGETTQDPPGGPPHDHIDYPRVSGVIRDVVRYERTWPLPNTRWQRLYLAAGPSGSVSSLNDGALLLTPPTASGQDTAPLATTPSAAGSRRTATLFANGVSSVIPTDQLQNEERIALTYSTAELAKNLEVTGPMVLTVWASTNAPDFDWYTVLTDVHPDGTSSYVSEAILRASLRRVDPGRLTIRNHAGDPIWLWYPSTAHEPVPSGELVKYELQLQPISNVFPAGHRIRLDVLTTEGQLDSPPSAVGTLTVAYGGASPSSLLLPVIPDRCHVGQSIAGGPRLQRCATSMQAAFGIPEQGAATTPVGSGSAPKRPPASVRGSKQLAATGLTSTASTVGLLLLGLATTLTLWRRKHLPRTSSGM